MYLIIGLGNPEPEYSNTRHNMGFDAVNKVAEEYGIEINRSKFNAFYGSGNICGENVILIKPQTFMNLSGKSVREFVNFYKVEFDNVLVLYDDMDVEKGNIKIRKKGGAGRSQWYEIGCCRTCKPRFSTNSYRHWNTRR